MKPGYVGTFYVSRLMNGDYRTSRLFPTKLVGWPGPGMKLMYRVHVYKKAAQ